MTSDIFTIETVEDFRNVIQDVIDCIYTEFDQAKQYYSVATFLEKTGLIKEAEDILKDKLQCAICFNISLDVCVTNCCHIFCEYCLDRSETKEKWLCPLCRKDLTKPVYTEQCRLYYIDNIIDLVMTKRNPQYLSWKEQQLLERYWQQVVRVLRCLRDSIFEFLEDFKNEEGVEKGMQELSILDQELLLLLELQCSRANGEHIKREQRKLGRSAMNIVREILQDLEFPVDEIESFPLVNYLSIYTD